MTFIITAACMCHIWMRVKGLASVLPAYHTVSDIPTYWQNRQIMVKSQSHTYSIECNVSLIYIIAYIALADSKAFCKAGRCINLNATTNLPHSLSVHKTIYNLFPPWWLLLTYAELRSCQSNLLLPFVYGESPFCSIKSQQRAWKLTHHYAVQR